MTSSDNLRGESQDGVCLFQSSGYLELFGTLLPLQTNGRDIARCYLFIEFFEARQCKEKTPFTYIVVVYGEWLATVRVVVWVAGYPG